MTIGQIINISFKRLKGNWMKYAVAFLLLSLPAIIGSILNYIGAAYVEYKYTYSSSDAATYYVSYLISGVTVEGVDYSLVKQAYDMALKFETVANLLSIVGFLCFSLPIAAYFLSAVDKSGMSVKSACGFILKNIPLTLLMGIKIFAWTLLFIIPGIIKAFAYSQSYYIKAENPDMSANECIKRSQEMMKGRKGKYFLMALILGIILSAFTYAAEVILTLVSLFYVSLYGSAVYYILNVVLSVIVSVIVTVGMGVFSNMMQAVFYVDAKRSYLDKIEQDLRMYHETGNSGSSAFGGSRGNSDPFVDNSATNHTHGDPFSDNNGSNGNSDN